jgi:hypothetical protein
VHLVGWHQSYSVTEQIQSPTTALLLIELLEEKWEREKGTEAAANTLAQDDANTCVVR